MFRRFLRHVAADLTAVQTAQLTGLNRNTVNRLLACLRERMAEVCESDSPFRGTVEVDESYFGPRRVRGRRGRGAANKTPVFGVFKRQGKVYTEVVPDCSKATLWAAIRCRVDIRSIIHSDGWAGYDGLVDKGYQKHLRVDTRRASSAADASAATTSTAPSYGCGASGVTPGPGRRDPAACTHTPSSSTSRRL